MYVVFCKIDHCIHIHWCIVMGLGHNDPWVESHMWPQQTRGQSSSRGQWPLVQVFGKKGQCIHILWCIFKSNITMIAKVCDRETGETRGSRTVLSDYVFHFQDCEGCYAPNVEGGSQWKMLKWSHLKSGSPIGTKLDLWMWYGNLHMFMRSNITFFMGRVTYVDNRSGSMLSWGHWPFW